MKDYIYKHRIVSNSVYFVFMEFSFIIHLLHMLSKRFLLLLLGFIFFQNVTKAQNRDSVLITPITNLGDIGWFYQFTFIHQKPINKVDFWVKKVKPFGKYDSLQMVQLIDELAAIKSKESYALLNILPPIILLLKVPYIMEVLRL